MTRSLLAMAILSCAILMLTDHLRAGRQRAIYGTAIHRTLRRIDSACALLNRILLGLTIVLALTVTALSTPDGGDFLHEAAAHPEWFGPPADIEAGVDFSQCDALSDCSAALGGAAVPGDPRAARPTATEQTGCMPQLRLSPARAISLAISRLASC